MSAVHSGPLLHVADLPSSLQNHLIQKKSQYLTAAAFAGPGQNSGFMNNVVDNPETFVSSLAAAGQPVPGMIPLPGVIPLMELERRAILNALEYTRGDRAVAAHLLGIGRTTLYRKLKEYQLAN
jgi:transcriptional regulator of acetoin/glycerol metabolism